MRLGIMIPILLILMSTYTVEAKSKQQLANDLVASLRGALRDPASMRIISFVRGSTPNANGVMTEVICGKVSARNGYGGMSGAVPFVFLPQGNQIHIIDPSITLDPDEMRLNSVIYNNFCAGSPKQDPFP